MSREPKGNSPEHEAVAVSVRGKPLGRLRRNKLKLQMATWLLPKACLKGGGKARILGGGRIATLEPPFDVREAEEMVQCHTA